VIHIKAIPVNQYGWPNLILLLVFGSAHALGWGTWEKEFPATVRTPAIVKWGVFHRSGKLTTHAPTQGPSSICETKSQLFLWVTHRLSPEEALTEAAGLRLGKEIAASNFPSCTSAVELDVEPITTLTPWLIPFVRGVRKNLPPGLRLRLAVYGPSAVAIPGPHWRPEDLEKLFVEVEGLDWMLYDTGLRDKQQYREYFGRSLVLAKSWLEKYPGREILLGLPAYSDKTARHHAATENVETVLEAWKAVAGRSGGECPRGLGLALFAAWSAKASDYENAERLFQWRRQQCGEGKTK